MQKNPAHAGLDTIGIIKLRKEPIFVNDQL